PARPEGRSAALRVWLKLLGVANRIEGEIRSRMRRRFGVTLPRFDLMAQLAKRPEGLTMGALGRSMMVTNGNVTGIAERLVAEGLVERLAQPGDRRAVLLRLTPEGEAAFAAMAAVHREWIEELFAEFA